MNTRNKNNLTDFFPTLAPVPRGEFDSVGAFPTFEPIGRPWRYEFPHRPSTSDPTAQPLFTVPEPEPEPGSVLVREFGATPAPESPPAGDPSGRTSPQE